MFTVTSFYAALLGFGAIVLANAVSAKRGKAGVSILHGDDMGLALWIRRHGNFIEYVPLALILLGLAEARGAGTTLLHGAGILLTAARVAHVIGLSATNGKHPLRIMGGVGTQVSMLAAIGYIFWSLR